MRQLLGQRLISRQQRDRRLLLLLVLLAVLFGLIGVNLVARLILAMVTPYGQVYPQSLLAQLSAAYQPLEAPAGAPPAPKPAGADAAGPDIAPNRVAPRPPRPAPA